MLPSIDKAVLLRKLPDLLLGVKLSEWKFCVLKLLLIQEIEHIALILGKIPCFF